MKSLINYFNTTTRPLFFRDTLFDRLEAIANDYVKDIVKTIIMNSKPLAKDNERFKIAMKVDGNKLSIYNDLFSTGVYPANMFKDTPEQQVIGDESTKVTVIDFKPFLPIKVIYMRNDEYDEEGKHTPNSQRLLIDYDEEPQSSQQLSDEPFEENEERNVEYEKLEIESGDIMSNIESD